MNFIEEFLEATADVESPTSFLVWSAIAGIASTLRDNAWVEFKSQMRFVYPNIYVLLIGDSGDTRKGLPLKIVSSLLKVIRNTKIIEGRASIQGVIKELASVTNREGKTIKNASGLLYSEEFAGFLVKDPGSTALLTDLYDYHEDWDYTLKNEEKISLHRVCLSLLTASNNAFLKGMFTDQDLKGGFVGRTFVLIEKLPRKKSSGWEEDKPEKIGSRENLLNLLHKISLYKGEIVPTRAARNFYNEWYHSIDTRTNSSGTGFEPRLHTHALKLAICLAAADDNWDMILHKQHIEKAIEMILPLVKNYHLLIKSITITQNQIASVATDVIVLLLATEDKKDTRRGLLRKLIGKVDIDTLDKAMATLEASEIITIESFGGELGYKITDKGKKYLLQEMNPQGRVN